MPGFCRKGGGRGACRHTSYLTDRIKVQIQWDRNMIAPIFEDRSEREGPLMNVSAVQAIYTKKKPTICCELMAATNLTKPVVDSSLRDENTSGNKMCVVAGEACSP